MILAFSTSSPFAGVALFEGGEVLATLRRESGMNASAVLSDLLRQALATSERTLADCEGFLADLGPGSFTGTRVGIMFAKALGMALGTRVAGITAFDLVNRDATVSIPVRKERWLVREPGSAPELREAPAGQGYGFEPATFPAAAHALFALPTLEWLAPEALLPAYVLAPSISQAKRPLSRFAPKPS